ncbi:reactive oxygen species modulator 1 [Cryptosporidium felis]|nr:reactive oxygen species modulator 1 [Cryptosporidium felis]
MSGSTLIPSAGSSEPLHWDSSDTHTVEESYPQKNGNSTNCTSQELLDSTLPPGGSFDGKKRPYEFRYPNSKRSLLPSEITPRVQSCVDNIRIGAKMGAIIGSIFGTVNGTYHAIKYKNYMAIPIFAVGFEIKGIIFLKVLLTFENIRLVEQSALDSSWVAE